MAENRGKAQNSRVKAVGSPLQQRVFSVDLGFGVKGHGLYRRLLIHQRLGCAVYAAARREHEALDSISFGDLEQHSGRGIVDFAGAAAVLIAGRIADNRRQVHHRLHSVQRAHHALNIPAVSHLQPEARVA